MTKRDLISVEDVAKILGISQLAVFKLVSENKLPFVQNKDETLFRIKDLEQIGDISLSNNTSGKNTAPKVLEYWMIPRSVRKWVTLQQMIRSDFQNGIIGSKWKGDRSNHKRRDAILQDTGLRGKSIEGFVDSNPGGARTDVALLAALGLYYFDDEGCIQLTHQGEQMLTSQNPAEILTEQMFQFRYPSPYSASIKMSEDIEIFPYRFLFRLLLREELIDDGSILDNDRVIRVTQKEIAQFVIPVAKKDDDLGSVVELIKEHRQSGQDLEPEQLYNDIANTFINNIEISGFIDRSKGSVWIKPDLNIIVDLSNRLAKKPRSFSYELGREMEFQQRLGMDPSKTKFTHTQSSNRKGGEIAMQYLLEEEFKNNPMTLKMIDKSFVARIAKSVGVSEDDANKVVNEVLSKDPTDYFSEQYILYSKSGRVFARDFEIATTKIFEELLGNGKARWTGKEGKSPDVIVDMLNQNGIADCKAESGYSIPNDHFNRMSVEDTGYIPAYGADFFIYIAESFGKSFIKNLRRIENKTKTRGSGIVAEDLLYLLNLHREKSFSEDQLLNLFTSSTIITKADINQFRR